MAIKNKQLIKNIKLNGEAQLYRFENQAGIQYSVIIQNDKERFLCKREQEENLINTWNKDLYMLSNQND